jgi:hypothetical protein
MMPKGIDDYMLSIQNNISLPKKDTHAKPKKIKTEDMEIPDLTNVDMMYKYNYNCEQLKIIARHYKIKPSGNKNQLFIRILMYLHFSRYITPIQGLFRGFLYRRFIGYKGPGLKNRGDCVNQDDFLTMDSVQEIPYMQFYSFRDMDGFIYGFDITSLYNLLFNNRPAGVLRATPKNPYNRNPIPVSVFTDLRRIVKLSRLFGIGVEIDIEEEVQTIRERTIPERVRDLCMKMDQMGHYTNVDWFLSLGTAKLRRFVRELTEIWNYRANIAPTIKREICPPLGDPMRHINYVELYVREESSLESKQQMVLECLEKLVTSGINDDSKCLGAYYVLGALTLVNRDVALAMPWLYESFEYALII